eukprot:691052-Pleurochrysis_carterae.AAC.8
MRVREWRVVPRAKSPNPRHSFKRYAAASLSAGAAHPLTNYFMQTLVPKPSSVRLKRSCSGPAAATAVDRAVGASR